jgi:hypothetical protein
MAIRISIHARRQARARLEERFRSWGVRGSFDRWLEHLADAAFHTGRTNGLGRKVYRGMQFVFDVRGDPAVLVTVIPSNAARRIPRFGRSRLHELNAEAEERLERSAALVDSLT